MSRLEYSWNSFIEDTDVISNYISAWGRKPYFVCLYKSSVPFAVKLSNKFKTSMSIIDITKMEEGVEVEFLVNKIPSKASMIIVLDTVLDTGETLGYVSEHLITNGYTNVTYMTLFNNVRAKKVEDFDLKVSNLRVSNGENIIFPWE